MFSIFSIPKLGEKRNGIFPDKYGKRLENTIFFVLLYEKLFVLCVFIAKKIRRGDFPNGRSCHPQTASKKKRDCTAVPFLLLFGFDDSRKEIGLLSVLFVRQL